MKNGKWSHFAVRVMFFSTREGLTVCATNIQASERFWRTRDGSLTTFSKNGCTRQGGVMITIHCKYDELISVQELKKKFHPENRNQHPQDQIERLAKILKYQGIRRPVSISNQSGKITTGHGRVMSADFMGMETFPVVYQDYEDETMEYADVQADNAIAEWANLDLKGINEDLEKIGPMDLELLGIRDFTVDFAEKLDPGCGEDEVPSDAPTRSMYGDIWQLGDHRVMCGDATNIQQIEELMNGVVPKLVYTDPPYGMNAVSKSGVLSKNYEKDIMGDDNPDVAKDAFQLIYGMYKDAKHVWWGANYYSSVLPDSECWLVWDKNNGQSDQADCELAWANFRSVVRMFTQASEKKDRVHPTQKPVSLIEWIFRRFKYESQTVLDVFGGSGSTLIACEKTGRKCYMSELDPKYVDVILRRWEKYAKKEAELILRTEENDQEEVSEKSDS